MHRILGNPGTLLVACAAIFLFMTGAASAQGFDGGNAAYDDGTAFEAYYFGGYMAGDPNDMYAVFFDLDDWGFEPYEAEITGLCAGNLIDVGVGAAWPWGYASVVDDPPGDPTTIPIVIK